MFFMHRGRSSIGGYGGNQAPGSYDRHASGAGRNSHSGLKFDSIEEAEFEEVK